MMINDSMTLSLLDNVIESPRFDGSQNTIFALLPSLRHLASQHLSI